MIRATVVCTMCENNEIYLKRRKKRKNTFHHAFHVPNFFCFPGKTGIPKIKELKDMLGDVCCVCITLIVYILTRSTKKVAVVEGEEKKVRRKRD